MLPAFHRIPHQASVPPASAGGRIRPAAWPSVLIAALAMGRAVSGSASETPLRPYMPTTVLVPGPRTGNSGAAYIVTPSPSGDSADLLLLNISSNLSSLSTSGAVSTLTSGLPFISSSSNTSTFTCTLASDGSIVVFAGDCSSSSGSGSAVWIYNTTSSQPSWTHHRVTSSDGTTGPHFLGSSIAFSETISPSVSSPQIYSYGGQCPRPTRNGTTWVHAADYSNALVRLSPSWNGYEAETLSLAAHPVAEAGLSLTQLLPSTTTISGTVTQDVNSVVLGGHTQGAFVNMSTAAVWALPEASWSFVSISGPFSTPSAATNELAKNGEDAVQVQSRSGHTAVLNEDGTKLVLLGGWLGDTSQAAEPQLAVLEMDSSEYGEWMWSIPEEQPLVDGHGIYGHGAALLPGNVMMVAGGYAISSSPGASSSRLGPRDGISLAGGQLPRFFNITSLSWADSYTTPLTTSSDPQSEHTSSSPQRLALGLGLSLGITLVLMLLAVAFVCVYRRRRHRRPHRDGAVRGGAAFITSEEMLEAEPWGPRGAAQWYSYYTGGHGAYLRGEQYESLRGPPGQDRENGTFDPAADYRGSLRHRPAPRVAKGLCRPAGVDESRSLGVISPIQEDEEDELSMHGAISPDEETEGSEDDPFVTTRGSAPPETPLRATPPHMGVCPDPGARSSTILLVVPAPSGPPTAPPARQAPTTGGAPPPQDPEVRDWVAAAAAAGRIARCAAGDHGLRPGAGRTQSARSDRSTFSFMPRRRDSLGGCHQDDDRNNNNTNNRGGTSHSNESSSSSSNSSSSAITTNSNSSSYATATSLPNPPHDGAGRLVLGRPRAISAIEPVADADWDGGEPGSPSKGRAPRRSWLGSLRRVFSSGGGGGGGAAVQQRQRRRKQGRAAWAEEGDGGAAGGEAAAVAAAAAAAHGQGVGVEGWDAGEWDIERAVEQRLVQVMFSVPKERLRIVNGEPDIISIEESVVVDPETDVDDDHDDDDDDDDDDGEEAVGELSPVLGEERVLGEGAEVRQAIASSSVMIYCQLPQASDALEGRGDEEKAARDQGKQRESMTAAEENEAVAGAQDRQREPERQPLLPRVPHVPGPDSDASDTPRRSLSPGVPMMAEAVRYERPLPLPRIRSRVQDMIEKFEQRSRSRSRSCSLVTDRLSPRCRGG